MATVKQPASPPVSRRSCPTLGLAAEPPRQNTLRSMVLRASLSFALALALTLLSVFVQREGPEVEAYGNLCGPAGNQDCYKPALKGGFPFAYLSDQPGVSVERQLSFGEDTLHPAALALDIAIYWSALMLALRFAKRMSVASSSTERHSEA